MILHILFCLKVNMAETPPKMASWTDAQNITGVITMLFLCCPLPTCYWKWSLDLPRNWWLHLQLHPLIQIPSPSKTQHTTDELRPSKITLACFHACCNLEASDCRLKQEIWKQKRWNHKWIIPGVISVGSLQNVDSCMFETCFTVH